MHVLQIALIHIFIYMTGQDQEGVGGHLVTGQSPGGEKAEGTGGSETDEEGKVQFF